MWLLTSSLLALGLLHTHFTLVSAQTTNTICASNSTTSFLFNDAGESPCLAWAKLQSLCVPQSAYINVPPLVDHTYGYNAPGADGTACQCNVAAYNLMAACSWCQVGDTGSWASQWAYAQGCPNFAEDGLAFSQSVVSIPPYAWRQWDTARFDPALAAAAAPSFQTTSLAPQSTTLSRSFTSISPPPSSSQSRPAGSSTSSLSNPPQPTGATDGQDSDDDEGTSMGVMIGAIAGAIGGVILLAMLIFFIVIRRRRKRNAAALAEDQSPPQTSELPKERAGVKRESRRFDPNYHSSVDWKNKHRSFLEMLTPTPKHDAFPPAKGKKAPMSELFNDPKSFFSPRPAPPPSGMVVATAKGSPRPTDSVESLRYTTTSERLKSRDRTESFSSGSELSFGVGPPKVTAYTKTKHATAAAGAGGGPDNTTSVFSMSTATDPPSAIPAGQGHIGLLQAVRDMDADDDPLETPPAKNFDGHTSYPFPRVTTPPILPAAAASGPGRGSPRPPNTGKALPSAPSRISTKIPDPRFSSSAQTMVTLPQPPIAPAHDFTLPPDEYRRKQSRHYSGPEPMSGEYGRQGQDVLPSLYEPMTGATRFSLSQRTDIGGGGGASRPTTYAPTPKDSGDALSATGSFTFSAAPSSASGTDSKYSSFIPDAQTINKVKAAFGVSSPSPTRTLRFPLPPNRSGSKGPEHEWEKAKTKEKLSHEVRKIGKKKSLTQERGNENSLRRGGEGD